ncbi:OmpA family protein [Pelagibacterium sp. 26DY04]|uniref:OmpA family protein n=1 Tax=Pelagibacterium sp. 26DY04 TaxID=2967130 RepID=UPI002815DF55|nr:OmpA family protein [Pelagibacterium sp. 26DY04]WMT88518.1 OmpA family protein [Pelagibacterium sp. 26DY04]
MAQFQTLGDVADEERPVEAEFSWSVRVANGETVLAGDVPHLTVKEMLIQRAGEQAIDRMGVSEGAPSGFFTDAVKAVEVSGLLDEGAVTYEDGDWTITGILIHPSERSSVETILGAETGLGSDWQIELKPEPLNEGDSNAVAEQETGYEPVRAEDSEIETPATGELSEDTETSIDLGDEAAHIEAVGDAGSPAEAIAGDPVAEDAATMEAERATSMTGDDRDQLCRDRIDDFMAGRSILFASGSARLTAESEESLEGVAEILADCPSAPVYVEGHTDADGGEDANLILSLSRAEAVVFKLTELGIDPQRLYAVGYGASLPVASNETAAGKAANRRIVFSFEDAAGTETGAGH